MSGEGLISSMRAMSRRDSEPQLDAGQRMAQATPVPPPSPAIYASESHKDRTAAEEFRR